MNEWDCVKLWVVVPKRHKVEQEFLFNPKRARQMNGQHRPNEVTKVGYNHTTTLQAPLVYLAISINHHEWNP